MTKKNDYVICHKEAHIFTSECGAPEFFNSGIKLITISSNDGKLNPTLINNCLEDNVDKNIVGVSVSQLSENGTNYSIESLKNIGDIEQEIKKYAGQIGVMFYYGESNFGKINYYSFLIQGNRRFIGLN